jgi:transcriptional regulator with GAF, ATPase, and Fis domain
LRNVIERAVIIARGGPLDFDVPRTGSSVDLDLGQGRIARERVPSSWTVDDSEPEYLTESEMRRRERENLFVVLQKAGWKIKGVDGAAELLGVKPNTLFARIEKMGLKRPA